MKSVKLVLCDIDGCLNAGLHAPLDLVSLHRIAHQISTLAERGISFSLCTGRPVSFAQAMAQCVGTSAPMICENGALVLDPSSGQLTAMVSTQDMTALQQFGDRILSLPRWAGEFTKEPGKIACLSLNGPSITGASSPDAIKAVMAEMQNVDGADSFHWAHSTTAIDITPKGIDKSIGATKVLGDMGLNWAEVAAIGDSNGDLPILSRVGIPMCPANAEQSVKAMARHCADAQHASGISELLQWLIENS